MTLVIERMCHYKQNYFDQLPDELFAHVLQYFNFKTRVKCSQVCRRWRQIFCSQRVNFALPDVAVFNIFESDVWDSKLAKSAKSKLNSFFLKNAGNLREIASQIGACSSVKIWFQSEKFVEKILAILSEKCFKFHCLDLYPFDTHLPLKKLFVYYPDLHALTLKPHGAEYFWNGMPLSHFPQDSRKLESLIIDSINIAENVVLPSTLTYLEWTHRDDTKFLFFINKLYNCPKLNYLSISHVFMHELSQRILFEFFEHLPQLMYLTFKFVRFTKPLTGSTGESDSPKNDDHVPFTTNQKSNGNNNDYASKTSVDEEFVGLKVLKFDLCYGDINWAFKQICAFYRHRRNENSSKNDLQIFSINTIWEEKQLKDVYSMIPVLAEANIWLQLGILQRQPIKKANSQAAQAEQNGSNQINGDANAAGDALIDAGAVRSPENTLNETLPVLPTKFNRVLCKLEMSFVESVPFLSSIFYCGSMYERVLEVKFVQCPAFRDCHFAWLAGSCPRLRKLQLTDCSSVKNEVVCLEEFLRQWTSRKSKCLQIIWRLCLFRDLNVLMEKLVAGKMCRRPHADNAEVEGSPPSTLSIKLDTKIWPDQCTDLSYTNGETKKNQRLTIYDSQSKMLTVQDYSPNELSTIFGAVIPTPVDDTPSDCTTNDREITNLVFGVNNL